MILCFSVALSTYANSTKETLNRILQEIPGCPSNSRCDEATGKIYQSFSKILKNRDLVKINKFMKENGFPLRSWSKSELPPNTISFDSKCAQHRIKTQRIYETISFLKGKRKDLIYREILSMKRSFIIQLGTQPLYITNNSITYLDEFDDQLFYLTIGAKLKGRIQFRANKEYKENSSVVCPTELVQEWKIKYGIEPGLYKSYYCKDIWNAQTSKYETFIFGHSC